MILYGSESDYNDDIFMYNIIIIFDVIFLFDEKFCNVVLI